MEHIINVLSKIYRFSKRSIRKSAKNKRLLVWQQLIVPIAIITAALFIYTGGIISRDYNYTHMLATIAKGESNDNYNARYGDAGSTSPNFTSMTVSEVLAWQKNHIDKGNPSSAVGRYQFIQPTLRELVDELSIEESSIFNEQLQDELAIELLKRRGVYDYMDGKISREEFAHNLSKEWAALPRAKGDKPNKSYYAGDGLNKVRVNINEVYSSMDALHMVESKNE